MHKYKVKKSEEHNSKPETMAFYRKVNCTAALDDVHTEKKEYTP